jgi:hypothetical protein
LLVFFVDLIFGISANGFSLTLFGFTFFFVMELDRHRLAFAAFERLSSVHNWRYVVDSLCSAREA